MPIPLRLKDIKYLIDVDDGKKPHVVDIDFSGSVIVMNFTYKDHIFSIPINHERWVKLHSQRKETAENPLAPVDYKGQQVIMIKKYARPAKALTKKRVRHNGELCWPVPVP